MKFDRDHILHGTTVERLNVSIVSWDVSVVQFVLPLTEHLFSSHMRSV